MTAVKNRKRRRLVETNEDGYKALETMTLNPFVVVVVVAHNDDTVALK